MRYDPSFPGSIPAERVPFSYNSGLSQAPRVSHRPARGERFTSFHRYWPKILLALERLGSSRKASSVALAIIILIYLILTALASSRRLWHDELYTFYIATAPSLSSLWQEIPLDLNPPFEYFAVRVSTALFGLSGYAVRLPSILAFLFGSLCLYRFVARKLDRWYGLLAILVFWGSPFFYYATEARPYGLVIGFLGLTLLLWRRAAEQRQSPVWVWLLGLSVSAMMLSHLMGPLYVVPFCLAELAGTYRLRKVRFEIWAALLLPCVIPFLYLHIMSRFEATIFPPAFQASFRKIAESYYGSLRLEGAPLLLALALAFSTGDPRNQTDAREKRQLGVSEIALAAGFLAMPAIVNLVLMPTRGAYFDRYAFPLEFGYALVVVFFLASQTNLSRGAPVAAFGVLLLFVCAFNLGPGLKKSVWARSESPDATRRLDGKSPGLPLVAASGLTFLEMDHYGDPQTTARLYYLTDRSLALRYAHATIFEGMPDIIGSFPIRAHVTPYSEFLREHSKFLVLGTPDYPEDWLLQALLDSHAKVQYIGDLPGPYKDKQLYLVTIGY